MELPKPPQDIELRNIIDKLAQFVARNGPEFEQMTKNKQKGNHKFSFLFGGDYFNYYQYKVTTEQASGWLGSGGGPPLPPPPPPLPPSSTVATLVGGNPPAAVTVGTAGLTTVEAIIQHQAVLHDQTTQSEQNLTAQHVVLLQQQQLATEEAIRKVEADRLHKQGDTLGINFQELDSVLQPIIDSCTKDSISNGKAWILQRSTSSMVNDVLANYLLHKTLDPEKKFNHKLHLIYLVNDILHHCVRKHTEDFKLALEKVVVPMFCNAALNVNDEQQAKLNKLLHIWESKNHYFSEEIVNQLKEPVTAWTQYKSLKFSQHQDLVNTIANATKNTFASFQSQHLAFVSHTIQQIQTLEQQKQQMEAQKQAAAAAQVEAMLDGSQQILQQFQHQAIQQQQQQQQQVVQQVVVEGPENGGGPPVGVGGPPQPPPSVATVFELGINVNQPPPGFIFPPPPSIELPDLTRPPPGFPPAPPPLPEVQPEDLLPSLPYYDLPAGLMVPLIKLEECSYRPLDPENIRLPPPAPPSERLLAAVKSFYSPPGHDQPRDSDGWEKLGLYEYFRAKSAAKKRKDQEIMEGMRERSRSPTPVRSHHGSSRSPPTRRRYSSRSRSRSRERVTSKNSSSSSESRSRRERNSRRERSRSPAPERSGGGGSSGNGSSPSGPPTSRQKEPSSQEMRREDTRSPTPPSFSVSYGREIMEERLTENNKGHQMLKKMGWAGAGLGANQQGIEAPISPGDVRDRVDQYKGVGINLNDPYENFRKSKGQAFITRMKARAEERS